MKDKPQCNGCPKSGKYCSVFSTIKEHSLENQCPCTACLVKIQCESWCSEFKDYCKYLYDNVDHNLVLAIMAQSTTVFTRKNAYVISDSEETL
jgi:hypothetical protein